MKSLHGGASATVAATAEECLAVLSAVDRYPRWYPDVVRAAEVLARDDEGSPTRAEVTLHVSRPPLERDFTLAMDVRVARPASVVLARIPHDPSDQEQFSVAWEIEERGDSRLVRLAVDARLAVPRFLPLGSVGEELADGFVDAAARVLRAASA